MTEVIVDRAGKAGQEVGDWVVRVGRGRGGRIESRHQLKSVAVKKARQKARGIARRQDVGVTLEIRKEKGHGSPDRHDYNGGHHEGNLLFTGGLIG